MVMFWVLLLAISILLYVLLDGVDLGVGMLFGLTNSEIRRGAMLSAVAPIWDGNETWLVVTAVILWGAFPVVYATLLSAFYLPLIVMLLGLILRASLRVSEQDRTAALDLGLEFCGRIVDRNVHTRDDGRRA